MSQAFAECVVKDAALAWLESLGYAIKHGPDITPCGDTLTLALPKGEGTFSGGTLSATVFRWERESISVLWLQLLQKCNNSIELIGEGTISKKEIVGGSGCQRLNRRKFEADEVLRIT